METPKKLFIFQETELSYISRNEAFLINISLIFQEVTFQARKIEKKNILKKFLIFREMELSYISGDNLQSLKIKSFLYFFL